MRKNLLLLITAVLLSMASAFAQGGTTGPLTWQLTGTAPNLTLTISGVGEMPDYDWVDGGDIFSAIGTAPWFEYHEYITTVVLENGVTTIGDLAFYKFSALTSITIPTNILTIGELAFCLCSTLTSVIISNGVTTIGECAFYYCTALPSVTIPNSVTTIGNAAFYCCSTLTSITIPNSVTTIGNNLFFYCTALTSVTFGNSVETIEIGIFYGCTALTSVNVDSGNPNYSSDNGVLFNKDKSTLICYPSGKTTESYTLPNSVTTIGNSAFSNCTALSSIILPNSVTIIGNSAFSFCTALSSITLPNGVTTIGDYAFSFCTALTSLVLGNSVVTIGNSAFYVCPALTSIDVENGNANYSSIDGVLFDKEKTILICYPAGKTNSSYTIPNGITTIENSAFLSCTALSSIILPNSVTTIGYMAFYGCTALSSINLPSNLTTIAGWTFGACTALTSIEIPNSVITIGERAFADCEALSSVTFGNSVTTIKYSAFADCTALTSVTNLNPEPIKITSDMGYYYYVFYGVDVTACTLKVLAGSVLEAYQNTEGWKDFNIVGCDYLVIASVNNTEFGYITGNEILYVANEEAILRAVSRNNHKFVNWTKDGVEISTDNPYSFTVREDIELVANFEKEVGIGKFKPTNIKIYPNPTTGQLKIESEEMRIENVEIFDVFGKKILSKKFLMSPETVINISHLPTGVYFVRIQAEASEVIKKVLKE